MDVSETDAASIELVCLSENGDDHGVIVVDEQAMLFRNGDLEGKIIGSTGKHIWAIFEGGIGGEIWVVERGTGRYARGGANVGCLDSSCETSLLSTFAAKGRCSQAVLGQ